MIFTYERELRSDLLQRNHAAPRVQRDPRTCLRNNLLLGYPFHHLRYSVIKNGAADFDDGHHGRFGALTPGDLAALCCYLYLPRHHAELLAAFDRGTSCTSPLWDFAHPTWVVDLGCGPGTAGLAFADHCPGAAFHYFGFDQSSAMRSEARSLLGRARDYGLIHSGSEIDFAADVCDLSALSGRITAGVNVLFVASYLFASRSLEPDSLASAVRSAVACDHVKAAAFLYLNSATAYANRSYEQFVRGLGPIERLGVEEQVIRYRRYASRTSGTARFITALSAT